MSVTILGTITIQSIMKIHGRNNAQKVDQISLFIFTIEELGGFITLL